MRALLRVATLLCAVTSSVTPAVAQGTAPPPAPKGLTSPECAVTADKNPSPPFNPAEYVRIYEERRGRRILLYQPCPGRPMSTLLRADEGSKIVVEVMTESAIVRDLAINGLFMRAVIARAGTNAATAPVEVLNYSEIPKDPATQAMQAALALRTAGDIRAVIQNLYDLTKDLVTAVYDDACTRDLPSEIKSVPRGTPAGCRYEFKPDGVTQMKTILRASRPRVDAVTGFFAADSNALVLTVIGDQVFGLDLRSLRGVAQKMAQDVTAFVDKDNQEALADLDVNIRRLWNDMQPLRVETRKATYFDDEWNRTVKPRLQRVLAPGSIDLPTNKAADGETLTLTVQARAAGGAGSGGVSQDFQIGIRRLYPRVSTEPSAFYLRRRGEIRNDKGEVVESTFAPAPGVTLGVVFYARNAFMSSLAPGVGVNVSFMNFAASDFDPSVKNAAGTVVGGFKSTTSSSIQVGTGATFSLFANALQFTYGWNLNVTKHHRYWGIGFGFLQVGEQIAKFAKK